MKVLVIEPGRHPYEASISYDLASMQSVVGGLIQAVYPFEEPVALICNEEGKLLGLPMNRALCDKDGDIYDIVAGTFFLCTAPPESSHFADLSDEQIKRYSERFSKIEYFMLNGKEGF